MKGVSAIIFIGLLGCSCAQFLNHRPFPTYSLENMPDTEFTCRDKILGGYYADVDTMCQMFHICVKVAGVGVQDFRFLCPNGTAFDQDHQICAEWEDVDCDASTLYYSSDNFDLYRIGSGFEAKAVKYGEDEETFALQRAETGDARLNREHQTQRVNQEKQQVRKNRPQNNNNERDIFKGSSSSNFFNNRNGGKETDDDDDDNVNANQNNDQFQKKKLQRKPQRRPVQNENNNQQQNRRPIQNDNQFNQNNQQSRRPVQNDNQNFQQNRRPVQQQNNDFQSNRQQPNNRRAQNDNDYQNNKQPVEAQTYRPNRPTGFANNFAGSSYVPTTSRPVSTPDTVETAKPKNPQYNNADNFRQNQNSPTPTYTISTPAPFKQNQQYNSPPQRQTTQYDNGQYKPTTAAPQKETENYPSNFPKQPTYSTTRFAQKQTENYPTQAPVNRNNKFSTQYDVPKVKPTESYPNQPSSNRNGGRSPSTENYPVNRNDNTPRRITTEAPKVTQYNTHYDVPKVRQPKQESAPTTFAPKFNKSPNPPQRNYDDNNNKRNNYNDNNNNNNRNNYNNNNNNRNNDNNNNFPSTFSPKTNNAYTQISHQTTQYNSQKSNNNNNQYNSTPKTTPFTQYTPTVPKISSTTPVARSNRYDETQYDDGSYNAKYDRNEDEFLKTAHSQNIASSRNEYSKSNRNVSPSTQKPHFESPRPFSVSPNTPKAVDVSKSTPRPVENKNVNPPSPKKTKDVSYDYAYYDSNVGEQEYDIDTEIKKSSAKN